MLLGSVLLASCGGTPTNPSVGPLPQPPPAVTIPRVDTSNPDHVVGTGTPQSCTEAALRDAVAEGGIVVFDCGPAEHTIALGAPLVIGMNAPETVIDGGGRVVLDGQDASRHLVLDAHFESLTPAVTVQRLSFVNGRSSGSGAEVSHGGGSIYRDGGELTVIECVFVNNRGPASGQDVAGGAIYSFGGGVTTVSASVFTGNRCSSGGALGHLGSDLVLVDSELRDNEATGFGGNPGNGGNGGAIYMDGRGRRLEIRSSTVAENRANARGGAVFRVSYEGEPTIIDRSTIDRNRIPVNSDSQAGGLYLQGTHAQITASTISRNEASSAGGVFMAAHGGQPGRLDMTNTTVAGNHALASLGGGIALSGAVTGTLWNCTIANNAASAENSFAGGLVGSGLALRNTVFSGNEAGNGWNPITCTSAQVDQGGNVQFPVERLGDGAGGGSDDPGALCAAGALTEDPRLGALGTHGGLTEVLVPSAGSPAIGLGSGCPETDQRGADRGEPCTAGAVEAP